MQLPDLVKQLQQELAAAEADVAAKTHALAKAHEHAAFLRGQIFALTQRIKIDTPVYTSSEENGSAPS